MQRCCRRPWLRNGRPENSAHQAVRQRGQLTPRTEVPTASTDCDSLFDMLFCRSAEHTTRDCNRRGARGRAWQGRSTQPGLAGCDRAATEPIPSIRLDAPVIALAQLQT